MRRPSSLVKMPSAGSSSTGVSGGVMSAFGTGNRLGGARGACGLGFLGAGFSGSSLAFFEGVPGRVKWIVFGRKLQRRRRRLAVLLEVRR